MTYKGHVENGAIVLDESVNLPEGAAVRVELAAVDARATGDGTPSLAESLASVIGKAEGLAGDWSEQHDKYLREEHGRQ